MKNNLSKYNLVVFIFMFFNCFSFITPAINPFIFALSISLVKNGFNIYITLLSIFIGLFVNFKYSIALMLFINISAILIIIKLISNIKFLKSSVYNYFGLFFMQTAFIYLNITSKTAIISVSISVIISLLFLYIYNIALNAIKYKGLSSIFSFDEKVALSVLIVSTTIGLSKINILGFYIIYPIALLVILFSSLILSNKNCLILACLMSISISLTNNSIISVAILIIWAVCCVLFSKQNKFIISLAIIVTDVLIGTVFNGYISYNYVNLLSVVVPCLILIITPNSIICNFKNYFNQNNIKIAEKYLIDNNNLTITKKLNNVSNVILNMSKLYKQLFIESANKESVSSFIASEVKNKICYNCNFQCENSSELRKVCNIALEKNKISLADLPSNYNYKCPFINQTIAYISEGVTEYNNFNKSIDNQNANIEALVNCCDGLYDVLKDYSCNLNGLKVDNSISSNELINEFSINNLQIKEACVLSGANNKIEQVLLVIKNEFVGNLKYAEVLYNIFNLKFVISEVSSVMNSVWQVVTYVVAPKYSVFLGVSQKAKQEVCGDNYLYERLNNFNHLLALADGMGTGEKANSISNVALDLLLEYSKINLNKSLMLQSINKLLVSKNNNNYSTLDIVEFDAYSGRADFIKLASSVSFIKKINNCEVIKGSSLPIGIIDAVTPSTQTVYLSSGDFIIICSDGVVDSFKENNLKDFIASERTLNAQLLADAIVEEASLLNKHQDDLTCCVLKINNY